MLISGCSTREENATLTATQPRGQEQQLTVHPADTPSEEPTNQIVRETPTNESLILTLIPGLYAVTSSIDGFNIYSINGEYIGLISFSQNPRADISSDGRFLAFDSPELGILDLYTGASEFLEDFPPGLDPSWNPKSDQIVVISSEDPYDFGSIFIFNLEENLKYRITFSRGLETDPAWSPNGKWISYASDEKREMIGNTELYVIDASCIENNSCQSAGRGIGSTSEEEWAAQPSWSPDSQMIVYSCGRGALGQDICIYNMASSSSRVIVNHPSDDMSPHWSPDGNLIGFTRKDNETFVNRAYIMKANGDEERPISETDRDESFTSWLVIE
jgi:Tol biopolymer transport system component